MNGFIDRHADRQAIVDETTTRHRQIRLDQVYIYIIDYRLYIPKYPYIYIISRLDMVRWLDENLPIPSDQTEVNSVVREGDKVWVKVRDVDDARHRSAPRCFFFGL